MSYKPGDMVLIRNEDGVALTAQIIEINTDNGEVCVLLETGTFVIYPPDLFIECMEEIW